jgi:hypothetical protein
MQSAATPSPSAARAVALSARRSDPLAAMTAAAARATPVVGTPPAAAVIPAAAVVVTPAVAAVAVDILPARARCTRRSAPLAARRRKSPSSRGTTSRSTAGSASRTSGPLRPAMGAATRSIGIPGSHRPGKSNRWRPVRSNPDWSFVVRDTRGRHPGDRLLNAPAFRATPPHRQSMASPDC